MEAWALIDPNWGEPTPVLGTIRRTESEAIEAALLDREASLYSGAFLSGATPQPGRLDLLQRHGFRVARVRVEIDAPSEGA